MFSHDREKFSIDNVNIPYTKASTYACLVKIWYVLGDFNRMKEIYLFFIDYTVKHESSNLHNSINLNGFAFHLQF